MSKAFDKLNSKKIKYEFIDFKKETPTEEKIKEWIEKAGLDKVINKRGLSWRNIDSKQKEKIHNGDVEQAIITIKGKPTLIKRPLIEYQGDVLIGLQELEFKLKEK